MDVQRSRTLLALLLALTIALASRALSAGESAEEASCACCECKPKVNGFRRAGNPQCVAWYAVRSNRPVYSGYYVGGGSAFHGGPPCMEEGTWGWDYVGYWLYRQVDLNWWHGQRYQGGIGAYKTDGPKLHHPH